MSTTTAQCEYCTEPTFGRLVGDKDRRRAATDHPDCYRAMLRELEPEQAAAMDAEEAANLEALANGQLHPEDQALLDSVEWLQPSGQPFCTRCGERGPTVCLGSVGTASGGGHALRYCPSCVGSMLTIARIQASNRRVAGYVPRLPALG
jgi:hypothetical protein